MNMRYTSSTSSAGPPAPAAAGTGAAVRMNATRRFAVEIPWWGKIAAKVVLARLPLDYRVWKRLHLFQHGTMEEPGYAHQVFKDHFDVVRSRRALDAGFV